MSEPDFYQDLSYPEPMEMRPYTVINMVATIDGKTITGERGEPVHDLGSDVDHAMMRRIQSSVEAVLIGAENQRTTPNLWYPKSLIRIVVTRSGNVLYPSRFFDDAPEKAFVFCPKAAELPQLPEAVTVLRFKGESVDWDEALEYLIDVHSVSSLLVEGGGDVNAQLLERDLVDELFLTVAPKVKLGSETPTYADGSPLPREAVMGFHLVEMHRAGDEVFLRYRRSGRE